MTVGVTIPKGERFRIAYHVTLRMFRYRTDGNVKSTVTYPMPTTLWIVDNMPHDSDDFCSAVAKAFLDRPFAK